MAQLIIEIVTPLWVASIPREWADFEAKFPGDTEFGNYAGTKIGAVAGSLLKLDSDKAQALIKGGIAKEVASEEEPLNGRSS